jgi:hypothetical protein
VTAYAEAERTKWLAGARIRAYNATALLLVLVGAMLAALPLALVDPARLALPGLALFVFGFGGGLVLRFRAIRALRVNNGAVALMTRGEDAAASSAFRVAASGYFGRDVVSMSLHNLGVLALRSLDLPSAAALQRAAVAAAAGFRFPWQPSYAADFARAQLAFVLAATDASALDEATSLLRGTKPLAAPLAIAFAVRARALIAARREDFDETAAILDEERALLRNVLPLNDAVLCEALHSYALTRLADPARPPQPVLADDVARAYVKHIFPAAESVLVA